MSLSVFFTNEEGKTRGEISAMQAVQSREKKRVFCETLRAMFEAAGSPGRIPMPKVNINKLLSGAAEVFKSKYGKDAVYPHAGFELTSVIRDKRFPGRALIVSYDHHMIESLKDVIHALNPQRRIGHSLAPVIEGCSDLYHSLAVKDADGNHAGFIDKPYGRVLIVRDFDRLNPETIRMRNAVGTTLRSGQVQAAYVDIADQLVNGIKPMSPENQAQYLHRYFSKSDHGRAATLQVA